MVLSTLYDKKMMIPHPSDTGLTFVSYLAVSYNIRCQISIWHNLMGFLCGFRRNRPVPNPYLNKRLHRFRVPFREEAVQLSYGAEVYKAGVQVGPALRIRPAAKMPEGIDPVRVIDVSIDSEYLAKTSPAVAKERLWKAGFLPKPFFTRQSR